MNFPICLAPMVGLSHVALREVVRAYLPANAKTIWPTEMLNSRRIPSEDLTTTPETMRSETEDYLTPQILGNEEKPIQESIQCLEKWGAVAIDINMGCPVQKALKHNYGVALMGDASYAAEVVAMAKKASNLPVSVKLRAVGSQKSLPELLSFVTGLQKSGADWICLHPRTAEQKRRGSADWQQITDLHRQVDFPIIGNGDVQTSEDAIHMLSETGCEMAMSGRGLAARPWMLWQLGRQWGFEEPVAQAGRILPQTPYEEGQEYGRCLLHLIESSRKYFGEDLAMRKVRFYIRTTSVWLDFGQEVVSIAAKSKSTAEMSEKISRLFEGEILMSPRTELRQ